MGYKIFFLFFLISVAAFGQDPVEINFVWKAAESGSQKFENAVMLVPVKFHSDTTTYFLQFDTGATHSSLYINRLDRVDLFEPDLVTSIGLIKFKKNKSMKGSDNSIFSVGTLGADFLKNKAVQIDFKNQIIKIGHNYDEDQYHLEKLSLLNGRPVVRITLGGQKEDLLYDTGSSLFGIWTTRKNWKKWRDKTDKPTVFPISSWGKINPAHYASFDSSVSISLGEKGISDNLKIWYVQNRRFRKFFRKNDLFGLLGNQPFLEEEILLDYPNKFFGIKKNYNRN